MSAVQDEALRIRPRIAQAPAGVDEALIERLVRAFYAQVRADTVLGPIFEEAIGDRWEPHLWKMFDFWSSVALTTGRYHGMPMQAHVRLKALQREHFARWLGIFESVAQEVCEPEVAAFFIEKAHRIAASLEMAVFRLPLPRRQA